MAGEPRIQYAKSPDGVSLAYWAMGSGRSLVYLPATPFTHVGLEWEIAECRAWYEWLVLSHRLIRYDSRGFGLSDRDVADQSLDANVADLHTIIESLKIEQAALMALSDSSMVAIAYAARCPERVSHLMLWSGWARRADVSNTPQTRSLRVLHDQDWHTYTETAARVILGWGAEEPARQFARFYRECATPEAIQSVIPEVYRWDVTPLLPRITCPVLVMQRRHLPNLDVSVARDLAAGFPDAQLVLFDGTSPIPWLGDAEAVVSTIAEFLGEEAPARVAPFGRSAPVTIMFTDLAGSTAITQHLGDELAQELLVRRHDRIVREALRRHAGREVKHTGDGIMAVFPSAVAATEAAIEIQRAAAEQSGDDAEVPVKVKIGINSGEPVAEGDDLYGSAVQLAARICEQAAPGQVLVANVVRELTTGKGFLYTDHGEPLLRGFDEVVRVYEVRWR